MSVSAAVFAQNQVNAKDVFTKIDQKQTIAYEGVTITGDLDLTELSNQKQKNDSKWGGQKSFESKVEVPLVFKNCTFKGSVIAYKVVKTGDKSHRILGFEVNGDNNDVYTADFQENVIFENCTFEEETQFKYSDFGGRTSFAGSRFSHDANFKYANFKNSATYDKCQFAGYANFKYADFKDLANFQENTFRAMADFKYSNFAEGVSFSGSTFRAFADFKYTDFNREGNFNNTNFAAGSEFKYASGRRAR